MQYDQHLKLGVINRLKIDRFTPHGIFLVSQDEKDVLLPQAYVTKEMKEGEILDVFLYTDSQDRLIATTLKPKAMLDQFALLEVIDKSSFGAFVDWGLPKDLLVPSMLQKTPFEIGEKRFLKIIYDEKTHRLVGSEKLGDFFAKKVKGLKNRQKVQILIIAKTPLGYKCIVEEKYEGLIYHNEIFENIKLGDTKDAYIKKIRSDGSIDISLREIGNKNTTTSEDKILNLLKQNKGILPYNYKSDAQLIKDIFEMSKKEFKKSLTALKEDSKIEIKESGIYIKT